MHGHFEKGRWMPDPPVGWNVNEVIHADKAELKEAYPELSEMIDDIDLKYRVEYSPGIRAEERRIEFTADVNVVDTFVEELNDFCNVSISTDHHKYGLRTNLRFVLTDEMLNNTPEEALKTIKTMTIKKALHDMGDLFIRQARRFREGSQPPIEDWIIDLPKSGNHDGSPCLMIDPSLPEGKIAVTPVMYYQLLREGAMLIRHKTRFWGIGHDSD
ncbi:MAG: hypothetical protein PHH09_08480 [Methanoregulaceae archaeon]|nr:hypothetical protein [Methanoregulaceae archaeon]